MLKQTVDRAGRAFPSSAALRKVHGTVLLSCLVVLGCTRAPSASESLLGTPGDVVASVRAQSFQRRALNVLLLSLLEPEDPPRWQDPTLATDCAGQVAITVDGAPLVAGRLLPAKAFELRWSGRGAAFLATTLPS